MENNHFDQTLSLIANFFDTCKVGYEGVEGYRKSTDLAKLGKGAQELTSLGFVDRHRTIFADLGCADGRVNILMSYFVKKSIGIEVDGEFLDEFSPREAVLKDRLKEAQLPLPLSNITLFQGDSLEPSTYQRIFTETRVRFEDIDLFYTYITLHDLFGEKIAKEAKQGALYLVYGFSRVLPHYDGLELLIPDLASQGIAALYRKGEV